MTKKKPVSTKTIGRSDIADFPKLDLKKINIKIDSGAYTSAIHCCRIEKASDNTIEVIFLDEEDPKYTGKIHRFESFKEKKVKSSNGEIERRFIVETEIIISSESYEISLSLTYRGDMRFPVLIGRKFLAKNHFVVNPRLKNHLHKKDFSKRKK
ncbi:MAG: peptidase [Pyrinomonadaceae bacterium]|nr:peptidase [Pyrinomonadaceae bacterium]